MNTDIVVLTANSIAVNTSGIFYNFRLPKSKALQGKLYASGGYNGNSWELPKGTWILLGKANDLTETEWRNVDLDKCKNFPDNFWRLYDMDDIYVSDNAKDSGLSLLKSKSLDPSTSVILIKQ